ncbi:hypothetical protein KC730_02535, partial [Candidatus Kaiserbacteria bacterium]|nr:hypothetical protein [Candidatus Kaiserbacteria bacterium]
LKRIVFVFSKRSAKVLLVANGGLAMTEEQKVPEEKQSIIDDIAEASGLSPEEVADAIDEALDVVIERNTSEKQP